MDELSKLAERLTDRQREVLLAMSDEKAPAPYCGWHRRCGQVAANLVQAGLADRFKGEKIDVPHYALTAQGLAVQAALRTLPEQDRRHEG